MPIPTGGGTTPPVVTFPGDWTGTLNGLAFGPGTPYEISVLTGWKTMKASPLGGMSSGGGSLPAPKGYTNGTWPVDYWMGAREVNLTFQVTPTPTMTFQQAMTALELATQPRGSGTDTLSLQLDGVTTTVTGAIDSRDPMTDFAYQFGHPVVTVSMMCFDPRRLASAMSGSTNLPASSGGLTFAATFPVTFNATQVTGALNMTNPGTTNGPLTLTITGPCTGPVITHQQTGATLAFSSSLVIATGDTLVIDCDNQTALYNGTVSRNAFISQRGWPAFVPGANTFAFNAAAFNASALVSATAYPAYI